jgi:MFS transporter, DHA2 family, multidrug resistance protein
MTTSIRRGPDNQETDNVTTDNMPADIPPRAGRREWVGLGVLALSLGLAPVFGLTTELIVGSAPPERAGAASGISETGAELGGALGIAALGSIGVAIYRGELADRLPAAVPAQVEAIARDTLGSAVAVAAELPDQLGAAVLATAREAFVRGMQLSSAIAAVVAVGLAVLALVMLRHRPAASAEAHADTKVVTASAARGGQPEAADA